MLGIAGTLFENILYQLELVRVNDGRVAVLHIVLWNRAVILHRLLRQEIRRIGFLKQSAAFVLFVFQDAAHRTFVPLFLSAWRRSAFFRQPLGDCLRRKASDEQAVDTLDHLGLILIDDHRPILALLVSEEPAVKTNG